MKKIIIITILIILFIILSILIFSKTNNQDNLIEEKGADKMEIYLKINDNILTATLDTNSSSEEFYKKLKEQDITINLHDYGNFEKVVDLGFNITRNDKKITTKPGDIILYLGNQITIYYDNNTWDFTKLGSIDNISQEKLKEILGPDDITVTFTLTK